MQGADRMRAPRPGPFQLASRILAATAANGSASPQLSEAEGIDPTIAGDIEPILGG